MAPPMDPTNVVGNRVAAAILDTFLLLVLSWVLSLFLAPIADIGPSDTGQTIVAWVFLILVSAYWTVLPGLTGWTVGKRVAEIRVVGEEGEVAGVGRYILRYLSWIADAFPYFIPG